MKGTARQKTRRRLGFESLAMAGVLCVFLSCSMQSKAFDAGREDLFVMECGEGDEQLSVQDFDKVGQIHAFHTMADGFFYVVSGTKLVELNSYGALMYAFKSPGTEEESAGTSGIRKVLRYPIIDANAIAIDGQNRVYIATAMPEEEWETENDAVHAWVVLRISKEDDDDYIGIQGIGGKPFPYIKNINTTADDELAVICEGEDVIQAWYFSKEGKQIAHINVPRIMEVDKKKLIVRDVLTDKQSMSLLICADSYGELDAADGGFRQTESRASGAAQNVRTFVIKMDAASGETHKGIEIPPYERIVSEDFGKVSYKMPYDFLAVANDDDMFFVVATDDGFALQIVSADGKRITRRGLKAERKGSVYNTLSVSASGIVSAFAVKNTGEANGYKASFMWWRTDSGRD